MIENDHRAYYTAGGRIWMMDLEPSEGKSRGCLAPAPARSSGQLPRVLLIDDTPDIAELLTFSLRDLGYEVVASGYTSGLNDLITEHSAERAGARLHRYDMSEALFDSVREPTPITRTFLLSSLVTRRNRRIQACVRARRAKFCLSQNLLQVRRWSSI